MRRLVAVGDQEGLDVTVCLEERLHVDDEVFLERQSLDRLDGDRGVHVQVLDQRLAGKPVQSVDPHGVGPTDAVGARAPVGEGAVLLPLDLVEGVQDAIGPEDLHLVVVPVGVSVDLGIEPSNAQGDGSALRCRLSGAGSRVVEWGVHSGGHQYLRSIGW